MLRKEDDLDLDGAIGVDLAAIHAGPQLTV